MKIINYFILFIICMVIIACQAGSSNQSAGSTNYINPSVNMGHIGIIPVGNGSSGKSLIKITNNLNTAITLTSATYSIIQNNTDNTAQPTSESNSQVDTSQCQNINAQSDCDIIVSAKNESESEYILNLTYRDNSSGNLFPLIGIVQFSNSIPDINGVRYSLPNTNLNNQLGNFTSITVPFQLTKAISKKPVATTDNNSVFNPTIDCPNNNGSSSYPQGTLCNLYVKVTDIKQAESIQGNIKVELALVDQSKKNSIKANSTYSFNIPLTVNKNLNGNLLVSSTNVIINPANGSVSKTITLLNNGYATINGIQINSTPGAPLVIPTNNCGSQLTPQSSCTFSISANSTVSGQAAVQLYYNNGNLPTTPNSNLSFNVIYIAASPTPGLSMYLQGDFTNVIVNTTRSYSVLVTNTGSTQINNIKFTPLTSPFSYSTASSCSTSGSRSLESGASCTLIVNYAPTAATSTNTLTVQADGSYNNGTQNFSTGVSIPYNAVINIVQAITINPNPVNMKFNDTQSLLLNLIYSNGLTTPIAYESSIIFSSSDTSVVNVVATSPSLVPTSPLPGTLTSLSKNGTAVITATYGTGTTNQVIAKFNVNVNSSYTPAGIYIFQNMGINNGYSLLTSALENTAYGIALTLMQNPSILLNQEFYIIGNQGAYNFKLFGNPALCIDLSNNNAIFGTQIQQWGCVNNQAQSINIVTSQTTIPNTGNLVQIKINGGCISRPVTYPNLIWDNCAAAYNIKSEQYWKIIRIL